MKMKIIGFKQNTFIEKDGEMDVQINPDSLKHTASIDYAKDMRVAVSGNEIKFNRMNNSSLSFDIVFDGTGIIPLKEGNVSDAINKLESVAYNIVNDIHEPNYLQISWGSFVFKGRMSSMDYEYNLFSSDGKPLRVKVSMHLAGYMDRETEAKQANRNSPDMSHTVTLKSGESIAWWCHKIYGDASYCTDVARFNRLQSFRNVAPGMQIIFPPLVRN
ncbi:MAG: hypothetical protein LBF85_07300 [Tannerella sp.]|jgi:hypothetical protein|nr:hypothetical protein [Tannerella sp.]